MSRLRLVMADDHQLVAEGLQLLLEPDFEMTTVADGLSLLKCCQDLRPDVVLMDIGMPPLNGIDTARKLRQQMPEVKILFLTMHGDPVYVEEALRAGAFGYVLKSSAIEELKTAIREVARGRTYLTELLPSDVRRQVLRRAKQRQPGTFLTTRQREVLQLVADGYSNKEIGEALRISVKTVEFHKESIKQRLGVGSTAELTRHARQKKLI